MEQAAVQKILEDAQAAVDAASIKGDLRPVAFDKAVDLLAGTGGRAPAAGAGAGGGGDDGAGSNGGRGGADVGDKAAALAKKMHIDAEKIERVYEFEKDDVSLTIRRSALPTDRAGATQELALLYAAARQSGGYDETHTKASLIRQRADDMGVLDANNFAAHLTAKTDWFTRKGDGANREFKVTRGGYEEAGKIVVKLAGGAK